MQLFVHTWKIIKNYEKMCFPSYQTYKRSAIHMKQSGPTYRKQLVNPSFKTNFQNVDQWINVVFFIDEHRLCEKREMKRFLYYATIYQAY